MPTNTLMYPGTSVPIYGYDTQAQGGYTPPNWAKINADSVSNTYAGINPEAQNAYKSLLASGNYTSFGSGGTPTVTGGGYNANPSPRAGQGPYGMVPGNVSVPPSTYEQTVGVAPGLGSGSTSQLTANILNELQGEIDPQALKNMQDAAAAYGVSSGMPGSNAIPGTLAFNKNLRNIGLDTYQVKQQGLKDYLSALAGIGQQQLSPALLAEIAAHNAQLNAAPDPTQANNQLLNNYFRNLNANRGPAGGTGNYDPVLQAWLNGTGSSGGALGFGGASGVGNSLGFGFGSFGNKAANNNTRGSSGYDYPTTTSYGAPINPETGEPLWDAWYNPSSTWGMDPSGTGWAGIDASNPSYWDPSNYSWDTGYNNSDYGDSTYFNDWMMNPEW